LKSKKLLLLTQKIGSGITPRGGSSVYIGAGTYLIRSQNIYNDHFEKDGLVCITDETADKMKTVEVLENDVLINITGDSVARTFIISKEFLPARVNQHVCILRTTSELNPYYLYYFLIDKKTQNYLLSMAESGGTRNALTKKMLEDLEIEYPDIETQVKLAFHLNVIKTKINLLQKQNHLLETIIKSIFKSWFIDFDGQIEFVDSELGQIPKGWNVQDIIEICKEITDGSHTSPKEFPSGTKRIASVKDMREYDIDFSSCKPISEQDYFQLIKNGCKPQRGDILFSKDGTMGITHVFNGIDNLVLLSSIAILRPKISSYFIYCYLRQKNIQDILIGGHSSGSALPRIVLKDLKKLRILVPEADMIKKFNMVIEPIFNQILENISSINTITKIHDSLLPKLISGEIQV